jgi:hypothetical protein
MSPENSHIFRLSQNFNQALSKRETWPGPEGISPGLGDGGKLGHLSGVQRRGSGSSAPVPRRALRRGRGRRRGRGGGGGRGDGSTGPPLGVGRRGGMVREARAAEGSRGRGEGSPERRSDAAKHHLLCSLRRSGVATCGERGGGDTVVDSKLLSCLEVLGGTR